MLMKYLNLGNYQNIMFLLLNAIGLKEDITEQKRSAEALHLSEHHLKSIIETSPECVKLVADDGTLQGIVTDRDLRHHLFGPGVFGHIGNVSVHTLLKAHSVKEIMSFPVVSVEPAASLEDAARLMRERKIGALPVVEAGRVVGILTETDLLRHICRADELCSPEVECIVVSYP